MGLHANIGDAPLHVVSILRTFSHSYNIHETRALCLCTSHCYQRVEGCATSKPGAKRVNADGCGGLAGQYRLPGGIGSQVLSPKRTGSATRFGSSTRDSASKVYISAEHEKGFVGLASPGPCTAVQVLLHMTAAPAG